MGSLLKKQQDKWSRLIFQASILLGPYIWDRFLDAQNDFVGCSFHVEGI